MLQTIIISLLVVSILAALLVYVIYHIRVEYYETIKTIDNDFKLDRPEEIFELLDRLMDAEIAYSIQIPFEGKDVKRITSFEDTLLGLTNNVIASINPTFIRKATHYGISEKYIYDYITRGCTLRILTYMKETNTGISKPTDQDEEE